ncbi:MAG TPA: hypothetical protein VFW49_00995 [Fluviicoccus sp.]|nr:hypothetical protein [Fluviicoccus sp.]
MNHNQLSTVTQFCQRHPAFPEGGLRHYLFYRKQNGLEASGAVIKIGRKLLINEARFFDWVNTMGAAK